MDGKTSKVILLDTTHGIQRIEDQFGQMTLGGEVCQKTHKKE
tara:strand:- start:3257 stop:3382 length:126 start_codon:yes stop_codon:yes gene_type:complete